MASGELSVDLGSLRLRSPLIAASGTVGSVWEWAEMADVSHYGAAVAKSVAPQPWEGRPAPRLAPTRTGMLNGIGIQNPGIDVWLEEMRDRPGVLRVPVWGSAVGDDPESFALVAKRLATVGIEAVEVNLSCPNLDGGEMFSFDPEASRRVVEAVASVVDLPVGAKLSPDTPDIVAVAAACGSAGADFVVLTNTALGFGVDLEKRKPLLSGGIGGYSGPGMKPISLSCVYEVAQAMPDLPIVGCGGVLAGSDVLEYVMAGASAVEMGTVHLAEPKAGARIRRELEELMSTLNITELRDVVGAAEA